MKNLKKMMCFSLATVMAVLTLASCGKSDSSSVAAPAGDDTPAASAPVEEKNPLNQAFLTGLEKTGDYPEGQRVTAVMVNNIAQARPQSGLSEADILVEIKVEGGITRFMALYDDYKTIPRVGPVRSARDQFFQLLVPTQGFYVHIGESVVQTEYKSKENYEEFDINGDRDANMIWRDQNRRNAGYALEHTAYTDGEHIAQHIQDFGLDDSRTYNSPYFNFLPYDEAPRVPADGETTNVPVIHSASYRTLFDYDGATKKYMMSQYNSRNGGVEPTIDENNQQQLGFDNLLILFTDITTYPGHEAKDLQRVEMGQGGGFYCSQGGYEFILWKKGGPIEPLQLTKGDKSDESITINPGTTYLSMVDMSNFDTFYEHMSTGTADVAVAAGEEGQNEEEFDF